jgi:hypothetical protein
MTNTVEARYDAETDVGVMHDEGLGTQIASLETAARTERIPSKCERGNKNAAPLI